MSRRSHDAVLQWRRDANAMNDALLPATNTILISGFTDGGTITGFAGGYPGRIVNLIFIDNISSVTVKNQSAGSSVGNRIASAQGTDSTISIGTLTGTFQHRTFMYNDTLSAWRYFTMYDGILSAWRYFTTL